MSDAVPGFDQPEPPTADELEVSAPDFEIDDSQTLPLAASVEEADETRAQWQDGNDESEPFSGEDDRLRGLRPIWYDDRSFGDAFGALGQLLSSCEGTVAHLTELLERGLDPRTIYADVGLNFPEGALVLSGLQALGLFSPRLRPAVHELLAKIIQLLPDFTDEQAEQVQAINAEINEERLAKIQERFATRVVDPDEQDAGLN